MPEQEATWFGRVLNFVRGFVPPGLDHDPDSRRRAMLVLSVTSSVGALAFIRGVSLVAAGFVGHGLLVILLTVAAVASALLLRSTGSLVTATNIFLLPCFLLGSVMAYWRGGIGAPVLLAIGIIPGVTMLFAGLRLGMVYFFAHLLCILGFALAKVSGFAIPDTLDTVWRLRVETVGAVLFSVTAFVVFYAFEVLKNAALVESALAEQRRLQAEKLKRMTEIARAETLRVLAHGLAHEVNNPLTIVMQNIKFTKDNLDRVLEPIARGAMDESLEDSTIACSRIAEIVRDIRTFAGDSASKNEVVDLRSVVAMATRMVRYEWTEGRLETNLPSGPALMLGDERPLIHALFNLIRHAVQTSLDRSTLIVQLSLSTTSATGASETGSHVIELRDNVPLALPQGEESLAFEAIVSNDIFESIGATMTRDITTGVGTRITITLPAIAPREA